MAQGSPRLGRLELEIMQVLWRRGQATAREITEEISTTKAISHSTVQTMLRKLEAKGAVTHENVDRVFVFRPAHEQSEVTTSATRDLLTRLFNGSVYGLVAHLLGHENLSRDELNKLRELIDREAKE